MSTLITVGQAQENLLVNSGFTGGTPKSGNYPGGTGAFTGWNYQILGDFGVWTVLNSESAYVSDVEYHDGVDALRVRNGNVQDGRAEAILYQDVSVKPNTTYSASTWVRARDVDGKGFGKNQNDLAELWIQELDASKHNVLAEHRTSVRKSGPYVLLTTSFITSTNTSFVRFILHTAIYCIFESGDITWDDCGLYASQSVHKSNINIPAAKSIINTSPLMPKLTNSGFIRESIKLSGKWDFRIDPTEIGESTGWFYPSTVFTQKINVPGAWQAQGVGVQSQKLFHDYSGSGWYRKTVVIPVSWKGKVIWLNFGGVHRYADVWVNGIKAGSHIGYLTPFKFDISKFVSAGDVASIVVKVDARQKPGVDPLQTGFDTVDEMWVTWSGIHRDVWLEATEKNWIENVFIVPHINTSTAEVRVELGGLVSSSSPRPLCVTGEVYDTSNLLVGKAKNNITPGNSTIVVPVHIASAKLWSPDCPHLYNIRVKLVEGSRQIDIKSERFGMREFKVQGNQFLLNGQRFFIRGYGDNGVYPNSIAPEANKNEFYRRMKLAKQYGFNYIRSQLFAMDEYFDVADELGLMVQPEFGIGAGVQYTPEIKDYYTTQWREIIKSRRNHPSIVTWNMGNEVYDALDIMPVLYKIAKQTDPTRLVIDSDGLVALSARVTNRNTLDFLTPQFYEMTYDGLNDIKYAVSSVKPNKPVVIHEMSNQNSLPDLSQIKLFNGGIRPFWLYDLQDSVKSKGFERVYPQWVANSQKLQTTCLKTTFEAARRSPDINGYTQFLFQDYYTGSNGIVDIFYRKKSLNPEDVRKFNSPTVILMDTPHRNYWSGETLNATILVSRYEHKPSTNVTLHWRVLDGASIVLFGEKAGLNIQSGRVAPFTSLSIRMPLCKVVHKLTLVVEFQDQNGRFSNAWNFWAFPKNRLTADEFRLYASGWKQLGTLYPWAYKQLNSSVLSGYDVVVTSKLTLAVIDYLENGGRVLLLSPKQVFPVLASSYKPCWWIGLLPGVDSNTGTVIKANHPAIAGIPNDGWCDLVYRELIKDSVAVNLDEMPVAVDPIIRCLDVNTTLRNKAYLFEMQVGRGRLFVSSLNFTDSIDSGDPAGTYLLDQLIRYASSANFVPKAQLSEQYLRSSTVPTYNGLADVQSGTESSAQYASFRDSVKRFWPVFALDSSKLEWESVPINIKDSDRICLMWTVGLWQELKHVPSDSFTLYVNENPVIKFGTTLNPAKWISDDGKVELYYDVKKGWFWHTSGVMHLILPVNILKDGQPVRLKVTGNSSSNNGDAFRLYDYQDTLEYENAHMLGRTVDVGW